MKQSVRPMSMKVCLEVRLSIGTVASQTRTDLAGQQIKDDLAMQLGDV
jgi:hypothetical protein